MYDQVSHQALVILNALRAASGSRTLLAELLNGGTIPQHTAAGIFGSAICKLAHADFIKIFDDQGADITEQVWKTGDPASYSFGPGFGVAEFLRGREPAISVCLTEKLGQVQSLLGVSVTQLLEDYRSTGMRIRPLFGKPCGLPRADVFVLMPFHSDFVPIYDDHIQKICERLNLDAKRADNIFGSSKIIDDVWELIANSKIIIADCTGRNPNVFYELGIAHTLGRPVIIITQSADDIPFDIRHIRFIKYDYTPRGMKEFESSLTRFIVEEHEKISNPSSRGNSSD